MPLLNAKCTKEKMIADASTCRTAGLILGLEYNKVLNNDNAKKGCINGVKGVVFNTAVKGTPTGPAPSICYKKESEIVIVKNSFSKLGEGDGSKNEDFGRF